MQHVEVHVDIAGEYADAVQADLLVRSARAAVDAAVADQYPNWELGEMSLRVTTDDEIHRLNSDYRHVDRPTDVLSFGYLEDDDEEMQGAFPPDWPAQIGEVIISYPYATRQAADLGHPVDMELAWLTIHGTLQILGYHHATDSEAEHMEGLERVALRALDFTVE